MQRRPNRFVTAVIPPRAGVGLDRIRGFWPALVLSVAVCVATAAGAADSRTECGSSDPDRSIIGCTAALAQSPAQTAGDQAAAYNSRGLAYEAKGDHDRAIADFDAAIRLDPNLADAYDNRGTAYEAKGDHDRAIADFDSAVRLDPKFVFAYIDRANAYFHKGEHDRAIADFDAAIRLDPNLAGAYYNRGLAHDAKGDRVAALADFRKMLELAPGDPQAIAAIAKVEQEMAADERQAAGAKPSAPSASPTVAAQPSPSPEPPAGVAANPWMDCTSGAPDRSIAGCTAVLAQASRETAADQAFAYLNRGNAYAAKDDLRAALADVYKSLELAPGNANALAAIARIKEKIAAAQKSLDALAAAAGVHVLPSPPVAESVPASPGAASTSPGWYAASSAAIGVRLGMIREHFAGLIESVPRLPAELDRAENIFIAEFEDNGIIYIGSFFLLFVGLGVAAEQLYHRITRPVRNWLLSRKLDTATERVRAVFARFLYALGVIVCFTIGSVGAFLLIDWPPLLKEILLGYLFAQLVVRLAFAFGQLFLAPGAERFRVVPIDTAAALFLFRRFAAIVALAAFGEVTIHLLGTFGFSPASRSMIEFCLTAVILGLATEIVWRCPRRPPSPAADGGLDGARLRQVSKWLATAYFGLLWLVWVSQASNLFWLAVFAVGMPMALRLTQQCVDHILRAPAGADAAGEDARSLEAVVLERGARSAIIILSALFLAHVWGIDLVALTTNDALGTRLTRGALNAVMIALIADFVWHVARAMIDRHLAATLAREDEEDHRRDAARIKTLLPILKNLLFTVILVLAGMMILSALGFEIGPLIASAGVIGVAVGFGAQTLVRDIISGIFYLFDDAFRVGEYIQSGSYRGTVESFSLRSVKLRHHRGALFTVPFGILGAVQNLSRDWVIDKITIGVSYETDLKEVRKIIKSIGARLAADPELARDIISPLKMQGVEQFGDYAIQIRLKMMTKPGEVQFMARRKALELIKTEFKANRINFALPMVQISNPDAGNDAGDAAAAHAGAQIAAVAAARPR